MRSPSVALIALLAVAAAGWGCGHGGGSMSPTLGPPKPSTIFTYQPPPGGRFDFVVHMANSDPNLKDLVVRIARAKEHISSRCQVEQAVDLYAHQVGTWPDGRPRISYAIGIHCAEDGQ